MEEIVYLVGGEALEQVSQRGSESPIPGHGQDQAGWGLDKPDLVEVALAHGVEVGTR